MSFPRFYVLPSLLPSLPLPLPIAALRTMVHPGDEAPNIPCCGVDWCIFVAAAALLLVFAAIFSGLTIALMAIDPMQLAVIRSSGTDSERLYASAIAPLLHDRHLLLVTLLIGNAVAAETLPVCLERIASSRTAVLLSVTLIIVFAEIIPQALFSKHKLQIGAFLARFVKFLTRLFYPAAFPIAKLLDFVLGKDNPTIYRRAALKELTKAHLDTGTGRGGSLSKDEVRILQGTLDMADKTARHAMRPLEDTFMLEADSELNMGTLKNIMATGHSRVPVYSKSLRRISSLLLVKDLLLIDPARRLTVHQAQREFPKLARPIQRIPHTFPLLDLLNLFRTGSARLALVVEEPDHVAHLSSLDACMPVGIITLEDVIEELIQEEILDESDQGVDVVAMLAHKFARKRADADQRESLQARGRSRALKQIISSHRSPAKKAASRRRGHAAAGTYPCALFLHAVHEEALPAAAIRCSSPPARSGLRFVIRLSFTCGLAVSHRCGQSWKKKHGNPSPWPRS